LGKIKRGKFINYTLFLFIGDTMTSELSAQNKRKKVMSFLKVWFWKNKESTEAQFNKFVDLLMDEFGYSERQILKVVDHLLLIQFLGRTEPGPNTVGPYKCIYIPTNETLESAVGTEDYVEIHRRFRPSTKFK
jgi:hypothetical protein